MYWLDNTSTDPFDNAADKNNIFSFTNQVANALEKSLDPSRIQNFFLTLENDAKKLNTQIGNGLTANAKNIQNIMQNVYKEGLKYGFAFGDAKDYMQAIQTSSQRMMSFTSKNVENAIMLGKALGVGAKEVGEMYSSFLQAGMSQETANAKLTTLMQTARKYGVDASVLTKTVSDNIYKAQLYGFKGGIDGLTKMAVQAQRVGASMDLASKAAEKAFDPESAIELASTMQMLGGSVGALADPFQLMNMAQSDMGALQDQILKSSASMVDFNSKTGEFKISPEMRRNMTQYAQSMGLTYEEVAKSAVKFRKEQEITSKIPFMAGMTDADRSVIASLAEIGPLGTIQIKDPNTDKMVDLSSMSNTQLQQILKEQQALDKDMAKDPKEIALNQLSVQDKMAKTLEEIKQQNIFQFSQSNIDKLLESTSKLTMYDQDKEKIGIDPTYQKLFDKITANANDLITPSLTAYQGIVTANNLFVKTITEGYVTMVEQAVKLLNTMTGLVGSNTPTGPGTDADGDGYFKGINDSNDEDATIHDFFIPSNASTMINTEFGGIMKKIIPNKSDALMGAPNEVFEDLFTLANYGNQVGKILPSKKTMGMGVETLSQYVEQKIVTENTSNVKLGVEPISVSVKLEGTGLNKDEISKLVDTNEINNAVIERLRGIFDETKLINSIPQLKV